MMNIQYYDICEKIFGQCTKDNKYEFQLLYLLFNYEMGYKFSKSKKEFADYFSEGRFKDYPEMSYVETKNRVGLSFTLNTECLLYCAIYGDQLTQIPLNIEHPYYSKLENANIKYRGMVFDEYFSKSIA